MRAVWLLLLLAACGPQSVGTGEMTPDPSASPAHPETDGLDHAIHRAVNDARTDDRLRALNWSPALAAVAERHSRDMAVRGYFDHVSPDGTSPQDRAASAGVDCDVSTGGGRRRVGVSENLFQTTLYESIRIRGTGPGAERTVDWFTRAELARRTVQGWLDSPGHRRNLFDRVSTSHGIGLATGPGDRLYVTQVLC